MLNRQDQSTAWKTGHHFPASRHLRLASLLICNKHTTAPAYLLFFDSYTAAVPGAQSGTSANNVWTPAAAQATWTTGTKCRVNADAATLYLRTTDTGATYTAYTTLAGALAGDTALQADLPTPCTMHVLDWIELPWIKAQADSECWLDKPLIGRRFDEGLYLLPSASATTYAALGADFFAAAEFTPTPDL